MDRMHSALWLVGCVPLLLGAGCRGPESPPPKDGMQHTNYGHQAIVERIWDLNRLADTPEHLLAKDPSRDRSEFDPNTYFDVLTHVSMAEEYTLDYVYDSDGGNGRPFLYAREVDTAPFETFDGYAQTVGGRKAAWEKERDFLEFVQTDGTPASYFELAVLKEMGGQFYLVWHAGHFRRRIIASEKGIENLIAAHSGAGGFTRRQKRKLRQVHPGPSVRFGDDGNVEVTYCTFTSWGGLSRVTYSVQRAYPHKTLSDTSELLVEYDCGIQY